MSAEKGTHYVNANYMHLSETFTNFNLIVAEICAVQLKLTAEKMYEAIQAAGESPELCSTPNTSRPLENRPRQRTKVNFTIS